MRYVQVVDLLIFIVCPLILAASLATTFPRRWHYYLAITVGGIVAMIFVARAFPDIVTLDSDQYGPIHGVDTWPFPWAAAATSFVVTATRLFGLSAKVSTAAGALTCMAVIGSGCWMT